MMEDTDEFLGAIETESSNRLWTIPLLLNDVSVDFKIDTGADITVIPETVFKQLKSTVLKPSVCSLSGLCQDNLRVCGLTKFTKTFLLYSTFINLWSGYLLYKLYILFLESMQSQTYN